MRLALQVSCQHNFPFTCAANFVYRLLLPAAMQAVEKILEKNLTPKSNFLIENRKCLLQYVMLSKVPRNMSFNPNEKKAAIS